MKNLKDVKDRYLKEPFQKRLGHLASDLLRISTFLENPKNIAVVNDIIEESKFFIEWLAPEAPPHVQEFLSDMQVKLVLCQYQILHHKESKKEKLALMSDAKKWSVKLLTFSGLLAS